MTDRELVVKYYRWLNQVRLDLGWFYSQFDERKLDFWITTVAIDRKVERAQRGAENFVGRTQDAPKLAPEQEDDG